MLRIIIGVLIALWLIGIVARIAGGLVHILLVVALCVFIYDRVSGRPA